LYFVTANDNDTGDHASVCQADTVHSVILHDIATLLAGFGCLLFMAARRMSGRHSVLPLSC